MTANRAPQATKSSAWLKIAGKAPPMAKARTASTTVRRSSSLGKPTDMPASTRPSTPIQAGLPA